jgi:hypothetical protein
VKKGDICCQHFTHTMRIGIPEITES